MSRPQDFTVGDSRASQAGTRGGIAVGVINRRQALGRIALEHPGTSPEALEKAYDMGRRAGEHAKRVRQAR